MGLVKQTPVCVQPAGILTSAFNKQNFGRVATSLQNFRLIGRLFAKRRTSETRQSYFGHPVHKKNLLSFTLFRLHKMTLYLHMLSKINKCNLTRYNTYLTC